MTLLKQVTKGIRRNPLLVLVYGVEGIGKSTWAAGAPNPIFLGAENGTDNLDVSRFPQMETWDAVCTALSELKNEKHDFKTVVIDTLDSLEPLLWRHICKKSGVPSIERAAGGYGKGYTEAMEKFMEFREQLEALREKGMNVILLAHGQVKPFMDPVTNIAYDRYELKLHKKSAPVFVEWVDAHLFANYEVFKTENSQGKEHAIGEGRRVMLTEKRPGHDAKNRFRLPFEIEMKYLTFANLVNDFYNNGLTVDAEKNKELLTACFEMVKNLKDKALAKKVFDSIQKAENNAAELNRILEKLKNLV